MDNSRLRPNLPPPRRVLTAPIPSSYQQQDPPTSHNIVETLYDHPNAKIIAFTASGRVLARNRPENHDLFAEEEPGTLSWSSHLERTIAVGQFRIYQTAGSVAFLSCGSALQPILPKSQCWCLDETNSKFVLQIRRPNYWRIELPVSDLDDQHQASLLPETLDKILQFEKTECPFKRSFTVILPERPRTPVVKRPWTPVNNGDEPESPLSQPSCATSPAPGARPIWGTTGADIATRRASARWRRGSELSTLSTETRNTDPSGALGGNEPDEDGRDCTRQHVSSDGVSGRRDSSPQRYGGISSAGHLLLYNQTNPPSPIKEDSSDLIACGIPSEAIEWRKGFSLSSQNHSRPRDPEVLGPILYANDQDPLDTRESTQHVARPDEQMAYELHEGTGAQGDARKTRLRRRVGRAIPRSVSTPHLRPGPRLLSQPRQGWANSMSPDQSPNSSESGSQDSARSVGSWRSSTNQLAVSPATSRPGSSTTFSCSPDDVERDMKGVESLQVPGSLDACISGSQQEKEVLNSTSAITPDLPTVIVSETKVTSIISDGQSGVSTGIIRDRGTIPSPHPTTSSFSVRRRGLPRLSSAADLFTSPLPSSEPRPKPRSRLDTVKQLPLTIISKTCEMLMGPPSHLIALMLKVASRIAAGQWTGIVYGYGEDGEAIPVQWDYSEGDFSDCSDDEPYMEEHHERHRARGRAQSVQAIRVSEDSRGWGVD